MTVHSTEELLRAMLMQATKAMNVAAAKIEADMYEEVGNFYSTAGTGRYQRTGNLGSSPRTSPVSSGGNSVGFDAYLELGSYSVPNPAFTSIGLASYFSPLQVFTAAEAGSAHIAGRPGFWARSEGKMQQELDSAIASFFG